LPDKKCSWCNQDHTFGTYRELAGVLAKVPGRVLVMQGERYLAIDEGSLNMAPWFYEISPARANKMRAEESPKIYIWENE
jgi:hypothetical protein